MSGVIPCDSGKVRKLRLKTKGDRKDRRLLLQSRERCSAVAPRDATRDGLVNPLERLEGRCREGEEAVDPVVGARKDRHPCEVAYQDGFEAPGCVGERHGRVESSRCRARTFFDVEFTVEFWIEPDSEPISSSPTIASELQCPNPPERLADNNCNNRCALRVHSSLDPKSNRIVIDSKSSDQELAYK
jgi:hypothetical protein